MTRWMLTRLTRPVSGAKPTRLTLNTLEERVVPAIHTWSNAGATHNWSESGNWAGSSPPTTGEAGGTIVVLPINDPLMIQDIAGLVVQRVNFTNTGVATLTMTTPLGIDSTSLNLSLVSSGTNTVSK